MPRRSPVYFSVAGIVPILLFSWLDPICLRSERAYRELHRRITHQAHLQHGPGPKQALPPLYSLELDQAGLPEETRLATAGRSIIWTFYLGLAAAFLAALLFLALS